MIKSLPNLISIYRLITIPFVAWFLLEGLYFYAAIFTLFIAISDFLDGLIARYFKVEILDNGKVIYAINGYDQITISHFNYRCNNGLPDTLEEGADPNTEIKHNYVIQALFDLHEWPECKT